MARIKSLIVQVKIDRAGAAHNCKGNARHRVEKGDVRLKVRNGRSWSHYCVSCAEIIIAHDIQKLTMLKALKVDDVISDQENVMQYPQNTGSRSSAAL